MTLTTTSRRPLRALLMMLLAITTFTAFTSCEPEDDVPYYLTGTWVQVAPTIDGYASYTFYGNGTGYYYVSDAWGEDEYDFNWWTDGPSGLVIDYGYGERYLFGYSLNRNNLYLYPDNGDDPLVLTAI